MEAMMALLSNDIVVIGICSVAGNWFIDNTTKTF